MWNLLVISSLLRSIKIWERSILLQLIIFYVFKQASCFSTWPSQILSCNLKVSSKSVLKHNSNLIVVSLTNLKRYLMVQTEQMCHCIFCGSVLCFISCLATFCFCLVICCRFFFFKLRKMSIFHTHLLEFFTKQDLYLY